MACPRATFARCCNEAFAAAAEVTWHSAMRAPGPLLGTSLIREPNLGGLLRLHAAAGFVDSGYSLSTANGSLHQLGPIEPLKRRCPAPPRATPFLGATSASTSQATLAGRGREPPPPCLDSASRRAGGKYEGISWGFA